MDESACQLTSCPMRMLFSLVSVPLHLVPTARMNVLPPPASSNHCDERGDDDGVKSRWWQCQTATRAGYDSLAHFAPKTIFIGSKPSTSLRPHPQLTSILHGNMRAFPVSNFLVPFPCRHQALLSSKTSYNWRKCFAMFIKHSNV